MQKNLLLLTFLFVSGNLLAQCDNLFFSEYVEGYANNKAVEIYNPTGDLVNLSNYSIARFSNGSTTAASNYIVQLPDVELEPYDVFVVVLDKQDMDLWDSQFDKPVWNGYNLIDTLFDIVTMEPLTDSLGNVIFGPQYQDGSALFGDEYNEEYDLQCKADAFLCPSYDINRTMYFNGNDAVALLEGTEVAPDGSNLIDVIGVIGENPETTIMEDAWVNEEGYWLTKDRTLTRKPEIETGRSELSDIVFAAGGTFTGTEWESTFKNSFEFLGVHNSTCAPSFTGNQYSCSLGVNTFEINTIPFQMFPNPNGTNNLNISAAENIQKVVVYNLMGQMLMQQEFDGVNERVTVDISNINKGMFLVNVYFSNDQLSIQKLVKE